MYVADVHKRPVDVLRTNICVLGFDQTTTEDLIWAIILANSYGTVPSARIDCLERIADGSIGRDADGEWGFRAVGEGCVEAAIIASALVADRTNSDLLSVQVGDADSEWSWWHGGGHWVNSASDKICGKRWA